MEQTHEEVKQDISWDEATGYLREMLPNGKFHVSLERAFRTSYPSNLSPYSIYAWHLGKDGHLGDMVASVTGSILSEAVNKFRDAIEKKLPLVKICECCGREVD